MKPVRVKEHYGKIIIKQINSQQGASNSVASPVKESGHGHSGKGLPKKEFQTPEIPHEAKANSADSLLRKDKRRATAKMIRKKTYVKWRRNNAA